MALCFKVLSVNDYIVLHCHCREREGEREREGGGEGEGEGESGEGGVGGWEGGMEVGGRERGSNATVTHSLKCVARCCLHFKMMLCRSQCYIFRDYQYFHLTEQFTGARFVDLCLWEVREQLPPFHSLHFPSVFLTIY